MSRRIEIDVPSFLAGSAVAAAAIGLCGFPSAATLALPLSLVSAVGAPGLAAGVASAALAVGAAWALGTRSPRGCRRWSLERGAQDDFVAYQRLSFPFLPQAFPEEEALKAEEWLLREVGPGPWGEADIGRALARQLRSRFRSLDQEPGHRAGLLVMFALKVLRHQGYEEFRDALAGCWASGPQSRDATWKTQELVGARLDDQALAERVMQVLKRLSAKHAYSETVLMALLAEARRTGVVSAAEFNWLKAVDRPLFYALATLGRPSHLVEGAGAACHHEAEVLLGKALEAPFVAPAVHGVRKLIARAVQSDGGPTGLPAPGGE